MLASAMEKAIGFYKKNISPGLFTSCIFRPTCSEYAAACYREHGFFKGTALTVYRLLRCNSLNKGGYDPPPVNKKKAKWVL